MKIADIAKAAGVSVGTVDRVLHNRGRVSPQTKLKIEKIINEYGYTPNAMARSLKNGSKLKIGILIPKLDSESGYWNKIYKGIIKASLELEAFNVSIVKEEFDRDKKDSLLTSGQKLIDLGVDAIALAPVIQEESYKFINKLDDMKYAFFDSSLSNTSPITENLQVAYKAGWCAARVMQLFTQNKKNYICIQMHDKAYNQEQRAKGFNDFFKDSDATLSNYIWNRESSISFTSFLDTILFENSIIDGIFVTNDATSIISKYISTQIKNNMPSIIGFDLVENNKEELLKGNISAIISQSPETQGYKTIMEIFRILFMKQKNSVDNKPIPINIILKENLL
ncbi:MAG: LacI family DNA-binding transcriptional regulator [Sphaerochaetaceae bacterium]|nr:LacI family DNA-binding transcriptional regulator [Sphaerochaetaceae bacterium]MDC7236242.1 LacI family DNA-binding transcriptional regulator [Sphaerochaetaceae bacterium]MDC7248755.1 LacI family DNA-binding transcriptional regulator [Sphaerochaetaceae bacterium]